jgi:pSer/pThr/pTyr-binding forkhead associated (FHA) protein
LQDREALVGRIFALEREAAEIPELRVRIAELEDENSRLRQELEILRPRPAPKVEDGVRTITLQVTTDSATKSFELKQGSFKIGRTGSSCEIALDDPDVSRMHSVIDASIPKISDLGSSTGTFVNGKKVAAANLQRGDTIQVGNTRIVINWR